MVTERALARVQRRRELPVRLMQPIQLVLHRRVIRPGGPAGRVPATLPAPVRLLGRAVAPVVQRLAARLVRAGLPSRAGPAAAGRYGAAGAAAWARAALAAAAQPLRQAGPSSALRSPKSAGEAVTRSRSSSRISTGGPAG